MPKDFHKAPKAWSQIKHQILGTYLSLFLGKLGATGRRIYYIDGFAGPGRLDDGSDGSPLIAAQQAANPVQKSRQGILHCINVEEDDETFANLERVTAPFAARGLVRNYHGRFQDHLAEILSEITEHTAFFFIDPFGTKGAELETLKRIASRRAKTEALVRYDDTRVKRLIVWAANNLESLDPAHRKTAERLRARVEQLTDEEAAIQAETELLFGTEIETREWLIKGYETQVKAKTEFRYSLHYPIKNPLTGGHRYYLVHFCSHADGYTYMANFMAQAERTYRQLCASSGELFGSQGQMEFMSIKKEVADKQERASMLAILHELPQIFSAKRWHGKRVANREVYAAIVDRFGWTVLRREYLKALRELEELRKIKMAGSKDNEYTDIGRTP